MPRRAVTFRRWQIVLAFAAVTASYIVMGLFLAHLSNQNADRIAEIQSNRLEGCTRIYEGIREVFKPFLPPTGTGTPKQRADIKKFNDTIDHLKSRCRIQTNPKGAS